MNKNNKKNNASSASIILLLTGKFVFFFLSDLTILTNRACTTTPGKFFKKVNSPATKLCLTTRRYS